MCRTQDEGGAHRAQLPARAPGRPSDAPQFSFMALCAALATAKHCLAFHSSSVRVWCAPTGACGLQAANPELDMPQILGMMQMAFDSEDPPIQYAHRGGPRPSYETHPMAPGNLTAAAMLAQGQLSDEDDMAEAGASQCLSLHSCLLCVLITQVVYGAAHTCAALPSEQILCKTAAF